MGSIQALFKETLEVSLTSVLQQFFRKYLINLPQMVIEKGQAPDVDLSYSMACARTCLIHEAFVTKE